MSFLPSRLLARRFGDLGAAPTGPAEVENTFACHALAADTASLRAAHPAYATLLRNGADEPVRLLAHDDAARRATVVSRALEARLDLPFGWLAVDDNRRTLVCDPAHTVQLEFEPIAHSASTIEDLSTAYRDNATSLHDEARSVLLALGDMRIVGVRSIEVAGRPAERYHFFAPGNARWFVHASVTLPAGRSLASCDLASLMLASLGFDLAPADLEPEQEIIIVTHGVTPKAPESAPSFLPRAPAPARDPGVCLGERRVACDCGVAFHRAVLLDPSAQDVAPHACLRCGTITCTRTMGDDGRFHGEPSWAAFVVPMPAPVLAWLAQWPRVRVDYRDSLWPMAAELVRKAHTFYPAPSRVENESALAALEQRFTAGAAVTAPAIAARLRTAGAPLTPPPADLPESLRRFGQVWEAFQLTPESPLKDLIFVAQLGHPASALGVELLLQRPDRFDVLAQALRSGDEVWRSAGHALARDCQPVDPRLPPLLIELLQQPSLARLRDVPDRVEGCHRFEALFLLIATLKLATPEMFAALAALQQRLLRRDPTLVDCLRAVLRELRGEPQPTLEERLHRGHLP